MVDTNDARTKRYAEREGPVNHYISTVPDNDL
jgi:hypothetical protein